MLAVFVHRRVVGADAIDDAFGERTGERIAVALAAKRRLEPALRVEVADVEVAKVDVMDTYVARHGQTFGLRAAHKLKRAGAGETTQMHARSGGAHQLKDRSERHRLGERRNAWQAEASRDLAVMRHAALGEPHILSPQPDRIAEGGGVLQRAPQDLRIGERRVRLRESNAAGVKELSHFREAL